MCLSYIVKLAYNLIDCKCNVTGKNKVKTEINFQNAVTFVLVKLAIMFKV